MNLVLIIFPRLLDKLVFHELLVYGWVAFFEPSFFRALAQIELGYT